MDDFLIPPKLDMEFLFKLLDLPINPRGFALFFDYVSRDGLPLRAFIPGKVLFSEDTAIKLKNFTKDNFEERLACLEKANSDKPKSFNESIILTQVVDVFYSEYENPKDILFFKSGSVRISRVLSKTDNSLYCFTKKDLTLEEMTEEERFHYYRDSKPDLEHEYEIYDYANLRVRFMHVTRDDFLKFRSKLTKHINNLNTGLPSKMERVHISAFSAKKDKLEVIEYFPSLPKRDTDNKLLIVKSLKNFIDTNKRFPEKNELWKVVLIEAKKDYTVEGQTIVGLANSGGNYTKKNFLDNFNKWSKGLV